MNKLLNDIGLALVWGKMKDFVTAFVATAISNLQPKEAGKGLSTEDYTTPEKTKLTGIEDGANNYTLPATLPADMITEDATHRFITDAEKAEYADKYTKSETDNLISGLADGMDWKTAVDNYAELATEYPTPEESWTVQVKGEGVYRYDGSDWVKIMEDTVIPLATDSLDGRMAKEDKTKLDGMSGIDYVHPTTPGNKHVPAGGTVGQVLYNQANGVGEWKDLPEAEEIEIISATEIDDICQ